MYLYFCFVHNAFSSGGCGRTGTFIAVSILLERLKTEGVVDVFHTVRGIRLQRPGMVRNEVSVLVVSFYFTAYILLFYYLLQDQYEFCYRTVLEYLDSFELYANFK